MGVGKMAFDPKIFEEGLAAAKKGTDRKLNPYSSDRTINPGKKRADDWEEGYDHNKFMNSFTNGRTKALQEIANKFPVLNNTYEIEGDKFQATNEYDAVKQAYKMADSITMVKYNGDDTWEYLAKFRGSNGGGKEKVIVKRVK
jgi:hypothetical protein